MSATSVPTRGTDPMPLSTWLEHYRHAWETASVAEITSIFTPDGIYRNNIFDPPNRGTEDIAAYWRAGPGHCRNIKVRFGVPVVGRDRVTVEWWTTMTDKNQKDITLPGCLLLRFNGEGLCTELEEYWMRRDGTLEPPEGWGRAR